MSRCPSVHLMTVSMMEPELRAVEMPRDLVTNPLSVSATTFVIISKTKSPIVLEKVGQVLQTWMVTDKSWDLAARSIWPMMVVRPSL